MKKLASITLVLVLFLSMSSVSAANPFVKKTGTVRLSVRSSTAAPIWIIEQQAEVRHKISDVMHGIQARNNATGILTLLLLSFVYGLFHAAGPGHRKSVVFAFFISKRSGWLEPLGIGSLLALLHAGASVLIVTGISLVTQHVFTRSNQLNMLTEYAAYLVLFILAALLLTHKVFLMFKHTNAQAPNATRKKGALAAVLISGFFPCPGATLILIFSLVNNMLILGILAVLAMSMGMGLVVSLAGYLALFGQKGLFFLLKHKAEKIERAGDILEILGLSMLVLFAGYMLFPLL